MYIRLHRPEIPLVAESFGLDHMEDFADPYKVLFESNPLPMWVYDSGSLKFLAVNRAAIEHYGYSREEFSGMTILDIRPPDEIPRLKQQLASLDQDNLKVEFAGVWKHRKRDGTRIEMKISSQALQFLNRPCRLVLAEDVTELRRSNEQLRLLEASINRVQDIVMITEAEPLSEPGPRIVYVNEAFFKRTGYRVEEAIGRSPRFLQGPNTDRAERKRIREALEKREPVRAQLINYTKAGQEIWSEMEIAPVLNPEGQCTHFVSVERDVTERKRAEHLLAKSEARLREAQRVANTGSWEWDITHRRVHWSDELFRIFGLAPQSLEITVESFLSRIHPGDREQVQAKIAAIRRNPGTFTESFRIVRPSGAVRFVLAHGERLTDAGAAQPLRIMGTVQDVTERKRAEEDRLRSAKLEAANKELEAFAYSVSHDLRAPLRTIDGFSKLLEEEYSSRLDEVGRGYLEYVQVATRRMNQLIEDLLQLSRVSSGELRRTTFDLGALAEMLVADLRKSNPSRNVEVRIAKNLLAEADPRLMRVALDNLLSNAWKFTGKIANPVIEFGAQNRDGETVYYVRDNGAGFSMEFSGRLFGVFQRLHQETEFSGTGVGLAIVQRIIHRHGGRIWAEAEVNQGATFYFTVPV